MAAPEEQRLSEESRSVAETEIPPYGRNDTSPLGHFHCPDNESLHSRFKICIMHTYLISLISLPYDG